MGKLVVVVVAAVVVAVVATTGDDDEARLTAIFQENLSKPFRILLELTMVEVGAVTRAKLQSNRHHQHAITKTFLQAGCPSCRYGLWQGWNRKVLTRDHPTREAAVFYRVLDRTCLNRTAWLSLSDRVTGHSPSHRDGDRPIFAVAAVTSSGLRSSARGNFVVRRTRTRFADSSFAVAGLAVSNSLPVYIQNTGSHAVFCRQLKTYLFTVPD